MVIAVEKGLDSIANHLKTLGYTVVDENYKNSIDAYVYENAGIMEIESYNFLSQSTFDSRGILMVNAKNKTPEEVAQILQNRIYGDILNFL